MQPHIINEANFNDEEVMEKHVKNLHSEFEGCYNPNGCGKITFMGKFEASTEVVTTERPSKASEDWAEFIKSMNKTNENIWAVALTLIKRSGNGLCKETIYINSKYRNDAIIYTSSWDGYGDIHRSTETYWRIEHILGPVLDAMGVEY